MNMVDAPRVLIVDDEVPQMEALCDTLKDQGYQTIGVASPKQALAELQKAKFDLLLADLMMPEMDGIALLRAALAIDKDLVGIMMTGHGTVDTAVEAMKAGALDYIAKPFRMSVILPVLSRAVAMRRLRIDKAVLEQQVHERTLELEAANKELEAFSYSVSHDLRAPLRAVEGFTKMALSDFSSQMPAEAQQLLTKATNNVHQMRQMIDDLLSFCRVGRQPLSKQPVKLVPLVYEVLNQLRAEPQNREPTVQVGELPACIGDRSLLKHVIFNLLSNAFKFTRGKGTQALIEIGCRKEGDGQAYFIRDNGAGFDMEHADKLFGVFQRMHSEEEFEGTGVGLSIARRIIERHGGRIWAEAEGGKGATFFFTTF